MARTITQRAQELARTISAAEHADIYLYNGPINERGFGSILEVFSRENPAAILVLTTNGGSANAAYRIARWFQSAYDQFGLLLLSYCKSAGTLIATGGNRLIMSAAGELGPLDVQLNKRDELWERRSGLTLRSAMTSLSERADNLFTSLLMSIKTGSGGQIRFKLAADLAVELTRGLFAPIYEKITPEGLGEDYQELMVAYEYGKRLARVGGNIPDEAINRLVHDYPSHDFVIDTLEARTLFRRVEDPTAAMYDLASQLDDLGYAPDSTKVTAIHLSKPDEKKADEGEEKGGSDGDPQAGNGQESSGSSDTSAA
jgi:hypothetical protein